MAPLTDSQAVPRTEAERIADAFHDALCTTSHHNSRAVYASAMRGETQPCRIKYDRIAASLVPAPLDVETLAAAMPGVESEPFTSVQTGVVVHGFMFLGTKRELAARIAAEYARLSAAASPTAPTCPETDDGKHDLADDDGHPRCLRCGAATPPEPRAASPTAHSAPPSEALLAFHTTEYTRALAASSDRDASPATPATVTNAAPSVTNVPMNEWHDGIQQMRPASPATPTECRHQNEAGLLCLRGPHTDLRHEFQRRIAGLASPATPDASALRTGNPYLDAIETFTDAAKEWMAERLVQGVMRGWGLSWRDGTYTDDQVLGRLRRAVEHLEAALTNTDDPHEWGKRAADVANQAFMAADPKRRADPASGDTERAS